MRCYQRYTPKGAESMDIKDLNVSKGLDYEYNLLMTSLHVCVSKHLMDEYFTVVWANDFFYESTLYTKEEYKAKYHNECSTYFKQDIRRSQWNFCQAQAQMYIRLATGRKAWNVSRGQKQASMT